MKTSFVFPILDHCKYYFHCHITQKNKLFLSKNICISFCEMQMFRFVSKYKLMKY